MFTNGLQNVQVNFFTRVDSDHVILYTFAVIYFKSERDTFKITQLSIYPGKHITRQNGLQLKKGQFKDLKEY